MNIPTPAYIFGGISLLICVAWFYFVPNEPKSGFMGDKFGTLTCLFTAIGLAFVVAELGQQRQDRNDDETAVIAAIGDEVNYVWRVYGPMLEFFEGFAKNDKIPPALPTAKVNFPIYEGNAAAIGRIKDAKLRSLFISGYSTLTGLFYDINDYQSRIAIYKADPADSNIDGKIKSHTQSIRWKIDEVRRTMGQLNQLLQAQK